MGRAPCCDKANVKKGPWSPEEDVKLKDYIESHGTGSNWIALPQKIGLKRCGKSCRLRWLNYLRPNIKHGGFSEEEENIICSLYISIGSRWSIIAAQLPGRTDNDIKNYWNTRLKKKLLGKQRKEQAAARNRVNSLKQKEMKTISVLNNNSTTTNYSPISPYQPIQDLGLGGVMMNNNHDSIKKLLIKLGGRFSDIDDDQQNINLHHHHYCSTTTLDHNIPSTSTSQQFYENSSIMNLLVSSTHPSGSSSLNNNNNIHDQLLLQNNYNHYDIIDGVANLHMLQGVLNSNDFPINVVDEQMAAFYNNNSAALQRLEGILDHQKNYFYGVDMMVINNGSTTAGTTNSTESSSTTTWADMTSLLVYPSLVTNDYIETGCPQQPDAGLLLQERDFDDSSYLGKL